VQRRRAAYRASGLCSGAVAGVDLVESLACLRCIGSITAEQPLERQLGSVARLVVTKQAGVVMEAQHQTVDLERELRGVRVLSQVARIDGQPDRAPELVTPTSLLT